LFSHSLGEPLSYGEENDCTFVALSEKLEGIGRPEDLYVSGLQAVGNSDTGSSAVTVGFGEQTGLTTGTSLGVEVSAGVSVGPIGLDVTSGLEQAETHGTFIGLDVAYRGEVGHLSEAHFTPERRYDFGLCIYHFVSDAGNAAYPVVDYVVVPAE
jgi:hypothetical protein